MRSCKQERGAKHARCLTLARSSQQPDMRWGGAHRVERCLPAVLRFREARDTDV